jgi:4-aminobutyrate aminotransferase/(S)-3-amino-2-methylpropionate transaminase
MTNLGCKGPFPGPKSQEILAVLDKYESKGETYTTNYRRPPIIDSAKGVYLKDIDGNTYLDFTAGFAALNAGHCPEPLLEVAIEQMRKVHHTAMIPVESRARLLKTLAQIAPGKLKENCRIHLDVSGTNAVEIAVKVAKSFTGRPLIVSFCGAYHGRSFGTLAVTSDAFFRNEFYPIMPGGVQFPYAYCYRCAFDRSYPECDLACVKYLEQALTNRKFGLADAKMGVNSVAAIIGEPAQGASGYIVPPKEFWPRVRELCDEYGILLIADEIQMGWGRSGKMFCMEVWDTTPDIMAVGKSISSGIAPLAATIASPEIMDCLKPTHQTVTFGGTPVACAVADATIHLIHEEKLATRAQNLGAYFLDGLRNLQTHHEMIGSIDGLGLILGVEFVRDRKTKEPASAETQAVIQEAMRRGLIVTLSGYYGNRINLVAPLIVEKAEIDQALSILDEAVGVVEANYGIRRTLSGAASSSRSS